MEPSNNNKKKPEFGFKAYQRSEGNSSEETSFYLSNPFPYDVHNDGENKRKRRLDCVVCGTGMGPTFRCNICPRTFHPDCVGLESIPAGNWTCLKCWDDIEVFKAKLAKKFDE